MLLRDFLYVDSDKVRGLLAQIDDGVIEQLSSTSGSDKQSGLGIKGFANHKQEWSSAETIHKSLGDSLFPTLEAALETLGLVNDVSDELADPEAWGSEMRGNYPPGSLVRITASASLFDARYMASTLAAFATSYQGLGNLGVIPKPTVPPLKKGQQGGQTSKKAIDSHDSRDLEDSIPNVDLDFGDGGAATSREVLQGLVRISRGMFTPGLHIHMRPAGDDSSFSVNARLQEGRQFLDSDPDVLFARYGTGAQQWTLVGAIGHYGMSAGPPGEGSSLVDDNDNVARSSFVTYANAFLSYIGNLGFVDMPSEPGFSVIPLAVYRTIGSYETPSGASLASI